MTDRRYAKADDGHASDAGGHGAHTITIETSQISRVSSYEPAHSTFFAVYYTLTGLHALHVFGGILVMIYHLMPISRRIYESDPDRFTNRIEITGLFWHFVDLVWISYSQSFIYSNRLMADEHNAEWYENTFKNDYWVGGVLIAGTAITYVIDKWGVAEKYGLLTAVIFGLTVATIKAATVIVIFMHLKWDWKFKTISVTLISTVLFFSGMMW